MQLKYGKTNLTVNVPREKICGIYMPQFMPGVKSLREEIFASLKDPIGTQGLEKIIAPGKSIAIIVDDITRAIPTDKILNIFIPCLKRCGAELKDITVICATGAHRGLSEEEFNKLLGRYYGRIKAVNHDCDNDERLIPLGKSSFGNQIRINKRFYESDIKIIICDTEFHQFCGYGGGAKSILPGIADRRSIESCHSRLEAEGSEPGRIEGNTVREEIEEAGRMAGVDFILNAVLNHKKEIVKVFSGDISRAFIAGTKLCDRIYKVRIPDQVDSVIISAGGYPRDINLYQAQKAIESAVRVVKKGGKVVLIAECRDGHGSEIFHKWMTEEPDLDAVIKRIKKKFILGAHKAYLIARELKWADVYIYSKMPCSLIRSYHMHPIDNVREINAVISDSDRIIVLPEAPITLPVIGSE